MMNKSHSYAGKHAMTVLGPISPVDLGITLIHEHLIIDLTCWWDELSESSERDRSTSPVRIEILGRLRRNPFYVKDNLRLSDVKMVADELNEFKKMGGRTVVESSSIGLGRDPIALRKISALTGVNVIAGTGYYVEQSHPPNVKKMNISDLATVMIRDLSVGIGSTDVKAGIIGEIGLSSPITKDEMKVLHAAAKAHQETGVPISIHQWSTPSTREGLDALGILKDEGVRLERVTIGHSDEKDLDLERKCLKAGAFINFDHFGLEFYYGDTVGLRFLCDAERVAKIAELVKDGYASQIMLSQDVCMKMQLRRYGGMGYDHILRSIVPMLQRAGVVAKDIRKMTEENPRRFLPS